jgi:hypothetical protein
MNGKGFVHKWTLPVETEKSCKETPVRISSLLVNIPTNVLPKKDGLNA